MSNINCINEIKEFIKLVKKEKYNNNNHNDNNDIYLYLESSDIYDKMIYTNVYKNGRIRYKNQEKNLINCPLKGANSISKNKVIEELKKDNIIEDKYHYFKHIDNEFYKSNIGKWYFYTIS